MQANSDPAAGAQWLGQAVACMEANELTEDSDGVALDAIREYQLQCAQQAAAAAAEPAAG